MADDLHAKVAVLEERLSAMGSNFTEMKGLIAQTNAELHAIRELIAAGKGAWWAGALLLGALVAVAGSVGALVHRLFP